MKAACIIMLIALAVLGVSGCIEEELSVDELIKEGNDAYLSNDYKKANGYYDKAIEKLQKEQVSINFKEITKNRAKDWWHSSESAHSRYRGYAICDVCNEEIPISGGYLIYTKEMVRSKAHMSEDVESSIDILVGFGVPEGEAKAQIYYATLNSQTPWLVCENCISKFC